jgi:hypothetical protein
MSKSLPIPEQEQLQALASGRTDVYGLLAQYLGDLNRAGDLRQYITVTKAQLADHLRRNPHLAEQHVFTPSTPKYHESPVLEAAGRKRRRKYVVYEVFHGKARDAREFKDLADAAAEYLMWNWGVAPSIRQSYAANKESAR